MTTKTPTEMSQERLFFSSSHDRDDQHSHSSSPTDPLLVQRRKDCSYDCDEDEYNKPAWWVSKVRSGEFHHIRRAIRKKLDLRVIGWALAAMLGNVMMVIYLVKLGLRIPNYSYFILNFGCLLYNIPFFIIAYLQHYLYKTITAEMTKPIWKFHLFVIGFFIGFNGLFIVFANPNVPGTLQTLLLQFIIPATMITSIIFLRSKYKLNQYLGALLVVVGIVVSLIPDFGNKENLLPNEGIFWIVIFIIGSIPGAFYNVYEEFAFRAQEMDIGYLMAWSNLGQWISLWLIAPFNLIPKFSPNGHTFHDLMIQYQDGLKCFVGIDTGTTGSTQDDPCDGMWIIFLLFCTGYVLNNFCSAALVKYGNATFSILISISSSILANFAFSARFIMGQFAVPVSWYDVLALLLVISGVVLYRFSSASHHEEKDTQNDNESGKGPSYAKVAPYSVENSVQ